MNLKMPLPRARRKRQDKEWDSAQNSSWLWAMLSLPTLDCPLQEEPGWEGASYKNCTCSTKISPWNWEVVHWGRNMFCLTPALHARDPGMVSSESYWTVQCSVLALFICLLCFEVLLEYIYIYNPIHICIYIICYGFIDMQSSFVLWFLFDIWTSHLILPMNKMRLPNTQDQVRLFLWTPGFLNPKLPVHEGGIHAMGFRESRECQPSNTPLKRISAWLWTVDFISMKLSPVKAEVEICCCFRVHLGWGIQPGPWENL